MCDDEDDRSIAAVCGRMRSATDDVEHSPTASTRPQRSGLQPRVLFNLRSQRASCGGAVEDRSNTARPRRRRQRVSCAGGRCRGHAGSRRAWAAEEAAMMEKLAAGRKSLALMALTAPKLRLTLSGRRCCTGWRSRLSASAKRPKKTRTAGVDHPVRTHRVCRVVCDRRYVESRRAGGLRCVSQRCWQGRDSPPATHRKTT